MNNIKKLLESRNNDKMDVELNVLLKSKGEELLSDFVEILKVIPDYSIVTLFVDDSLSEWEKIYELTPMSEQLEEFNYVENYIVGKKDGKVMILCNCYDNIEYELIEIEDITLHLISSQERLSIINHISSIFKNKRFIDMVEQADLINNIENTF